MAENLAGERDFNARRNIRIAGLNGGTQCARDRAGIVLVAPYRRRVQPSFPIYVHAGGKRGAASAAAWGAGTYVRKIHQDGFRRDVVRTVGGERRRAAIIEKPVTRLIKVVVAILGVI